MKVGGLTAEVYMYFCNTVRKEFESVLFRGDSFDDYIKNIGSSNNIISVVNSLNSQEAMIFYNRLFNKGESCYNDDGGFRLVASIKEQCFFSVYSGCASEKGGSSRRAWKSVLWDIASKIQLLMPPAKENG
jgi:hypothetical protein